MKKHFILFVLMLSVTLGLQAQTKWAATWATAIEAPFSDNDMPETTLTDNALRQVIHVSIGGEKLRLQLSNESIIVLSAFVLGMSEGTTLGWCRQS